MANIIKIMIVDDNQGMRNNLRKLLELEADIEVTCEAATGEEAVRKTKIMMPDVIIMDINMPGMDGIATTEIIANEMPQSLIIIVSVQCEQEYMRRAMVAGAKDYLVKPCESKELLKCIRHIYEREQKKREKVIPVPQAPALGKVITIFSAKGGVGKTTVATNLATALGFDKEKKISILDMNLQFGDVAVFLNSMPEKTIVDLVNNIDILDGSVLDMCMNQYTENIKVLAAPLRPEQADCVLPEHITAIINEMRYHYDYIVIDTATVFNGILFNILDLSDEIIVVAAQDLPALKNVKLCLEILNSLNYSKEKIKVILNRAHSPGGITLKDAKELIQKDILECIPSDGKTVVTTVNQGVPFVTRAPHTDVAQAMIRIANNVSGSDQQCIRFQTINNIDDEENHKKNKGNIFLNAISSWKF